MHYQNLELDITGKICIVTLARPEALNALNIRTMEELHHLFSEDLPRKHEVSGIILTGKGDKAFVAGADIKEFLDLNAESGFRMSQQGQEVFSLIERFPRPVVAAVNGFALGGGCELAMACHLRIAEEHALFGQPEVNLGIIPGYGGTQRLIQYIGKGKAMEMLMTGDMLNAEDALRLGLVNHVTPKGKSVEKAEEILGKVFAKGPLAIARIISCVNAYFDYGIDGFLKEVQDFGATTGTKDFREGANAFIEKRKPRFSGE